MRKSLFALPFVAAGLVFACGGTGRESFYQDKPATEPEDAGPSGSNGFDRGEFDDLDGTEDGGCGSSSTSLARTPVVLEFVVDESTSMNSEGKWTAQRDALTAAFTDMSLTPDPALFVGMELYGATKATAVVKPEPFTTAGHLDELIAPIDKDGGEGSGTATPDALEYGYGVVNRFKPPASSGLDSTSIKKVVILMSDGKPSGGDTAQTKSIELAEDAAQQTAPANPVLTFSIGVGPFPTSGTGYDPAFMGRIAVAGGTAPAGCDPTSSDISQVCHFQITPGGDVAALTSSFLAAINKIRSLSTGCEFAFKATSTTDLGSVLVTVTDADGKKKKVRNNATNGWTFDNESAPTKVVLHGAACSAASASVAGAVDVVLGCKVAK